MLKKVLVFLALLLGGGNDAPAGSPPAKTGIASWYGEAHRGKVMANGKRFNPDRLTAASWFYPLGTKLRVSVKEPFQGQTQARSVLVTVTDRGPALDLVRDGRVIDLARAAFRRLTSTDYGLVPVTIRPVQEPL